MKWFLWWRVTMPWGPVLKGPSIGELRTNAPVGKETWNASFEINTVNLFQAGYFGVCLKEAICFFPGLYSFQKQCDEVFFHRCSFKHGFQVTCYDMPDTKQNKRKSNNQVFVQYSGGNTHKNPQLKHCGLSAGPQQHGRKEESFEKRDDREGTGGRGSILNWRGQHGSLRRRCCLIWMGRIKYDWQ